MSGWRPPSGGCSTRAKTRVCGASAWRDAMTEHARLLERAAALTLDAARAEEAQREVLTHFAAREDEQRQIAAERARLQQTAADARRALDTEADALGRARDEVRLVDEAIQELRAKTDETEAAIREARRALEAIREARADAEVSRARAASDLSHLEATCHDTLSCSLEAIIAEVERMERDGDVSPDWRTIYAEEPDEEAQAGRPQPPAARASLRPGPGGSPPPRRPRRTWSRRRDR